MLKLTRYPGQAIKIGDDVEVVVLQVSGRNVRLGVIAPKERKILRTELDRENEDRGRHREGGEPHRD